MTSCKRARSESGSSESGSESESGSGSGSTPVRVFVTYSAFGSLEEYGFVSSRVLVLDSKGFEAHVKALAGDNGYDDDELPAFLSVAKDFKSTMVEFATKRSRDTLPPIFMCTVTEDGIVFDTAHAGGLDDGTLRTLEETLSIDDTHEDFDHLRVVITGLTPPAPFKPEATGPWAADGPKLDFDLVLNVIEDA